jgi:glycerol-3-phosphate dehydrogenase subunit B
VGDAVARIHVSRGSVTGVEMQAAARTHLVRTGALVLATGGIAGGGLVARADGTLEEPLLGLRVVAPAADAWLARDGLDPAGHPIDGAGVVVDARLRPLGPGGRPAFPNVAVAGGILAGQHAVRERCGDGVAIASGWRAAGELAAGAAGAPAVHEPASGRAQA